MSDPSSTVEEITILIAGLELTLTARPAGASAGNQGAVFSIASESLAGASAQSPFVLGYDPVDQALIDRATAATGRPSLTKASSVSICAGLRSCGPGSDRQGHRCYWQHFTS
eukprot:Skav222715  [mRNA]  locus=scaffold1661:318367:318702:- [translate_table: standard]